MTEKLTITALPEKLAVIRLPQNAEIPQWALLSKIFTTISRTRDELSIVCPQEIIPADIKIADEWKDWIALKVEGPLPPDMIGVLSRLADPLAKASISIFAISTWDTDYILVKADKVEQAKKVLGEFCNVRDLPVAA